MSNTNKKTFDPINYKETKTYLEVPEKAPFGLADVKKVVIKYKRKKINKEEMENEIKNIISEIFKYKMDKLHNKTLSISEGFKKSEKESIERKIKERYDSFFQLSNGEFDYINGTNSFQSL